MRAVEQALMAELRTLGLPLDSAALAQCAVDLARRIDAGPGDRSAVMLARELRLLMAELTRVKGDATGDVEAFLARIAAPDVGYPTD